MRGRPVPMLVSQRKLGHTGRMERHGNPNWRGAVQRAQAPQLPSMAPAPPVEERYNMTHGYHGEFASSGNPQVTGQKSTGQAAQKGPAGKQYTQATQGNVQQQIAQLLAEAQHLEELARIDTQQAATIQMQLNAVLNELAFLTAPLTGSSAGTAASAQAAGAATSAGLAGTATGTPTTGAAASGTPTSGSTGTQSLTSSTTSYADQINTLQGQASAYRSQISSLQQQAAQYNSQAASLRAQAAALGGPASSATAQPAAKQGVGRGGV